MRCSKEAVKRVTRPAHKLLKRYGRIAERWKVWQLEGELKGLERERGFAYREGNVIIAQALRNELRERKNRLRADVKPSVKRRHTLVHSAGNYSAGNYSADKGCCENEGGLI